VANVYDRWHWRRFWRANELPLVLDTLKTQPPPRRVVDIGCGTGESSEVLRDDAEVVIGVDPSLGMLAEAKKRVKRTVSLRVGRASALPLTDGEVTFALCARSLCHETELDLAVREVARASVRGGLWLISDIHPAHNYPRTRIPINGEDVHIQTIKRTPQQILEAALSGKLWQLEWIRDFFWKDLSWRPMDPEFDAIDRTGSCPIFFAVLLRRVND
jgi:ubiquinone/menaquinone biosynthesis C-methylase UbiE